MNTLRKPLKATIITGILLVILLVGVFSVYLLPRFVSPVTTSIPITGTTIPQAEGMQDLRFVRLQHVLAKARRGESITVAGIGGSITEGSSASSSEKRYIDLVYNWWDKHFSGQVTLINAGVGGTGSGFGTHRAEIDLLNYNPDFVIVDFAVNDLGMPSRESTLEGLVRKILHKPNSPAMMLIYFMDKTGGTVQADFSPLAEYYQIPQILYADRITQLSSAGTISLDDVFADSLHPNNLGHAYAADFAIEYLNEEYEDLPTADSDIPTIPSLPAPLYSDTFQYTLFYNNETIAPLETGNWRKGSFDRGMGSGWIGSTVGDELTFPDLLGTALGIQIRKQRNVVYGMAEIWIDNGAHVKLDAYLPYSAGPWPGPTALYVPLADKLSMAKHTLHIRIVNDKNAEISSNSNHTFEIMNILVDGVLQDDLQDWSYSYSHSEDLALDNAYPDRMEGDTSRAFRTGAGSVEIVWYYRNVTNFEAVMFFQPGEPVLHNDFFLSPDGINWKPATPKVSEGSGNWIKYVYVLTDLSDVNFIKTAWKSPGSSPELGQVTLFSFPRINLIGNPGFESKWASWQPGSSFWSISTEESHSGSKSLLSVDSQWNGTVQSDFTVWPYTTYSLACWAKSSGAHLKVLDPGLGVLLDLVTTRNDQWQEYSAKFNSGSNSSLRLYIGTGSAGPHYFDDCEIL